MAVPVLESRVKRRPKAKKRAMERRKSSPAAPVLRIAAIMLKRKITIPVIKHKTPAHANINAAPPIRPMNAMNLALSHVSAIVFRMPHFPNFTFPIISQIARRRHLPSKKTKNAADLRHDGMTEGRRQLADLIKTGRGKRPTPLTLYLLISSHTCCRRFSSSSLPNCPPM